MKVKNFREVRQYVTSVICLLWNRKARLTQMQRTLLPHPCLKRQTRCNITELVKILWSKIFLWCNCYVHPQNYCLCFQTHPQKPCNSYNRHHLHCWFMSHHTHTWIESFLLHSYCSTYFLFPFLSFQYHLLLKCFIVFIGPLAFLPYFCCIFRFF